MSLIRIAARIAAVEALKGKTLVGDNVLDSEIGAIDISADGSARTDEEKAFIAVYTDAATTGDATLRSLAVNGTTDFLFETGVTAAMTERDPETGAAVIVPGIPATDRAFEFFMDMVVRQIGDALTDPDNAWAEVFRRLCVKFVSIKRSRTSGDHGGTRMAAQQVLVQADLLPDPPRGLDLAPTHALVRFFDMAGLLNDPVIDAQVALMKAQQAGDIGHFKVMRSRFGRTSGETDASGLATAGASIAEVSIGDL